MKFYIIANSDIYEFNTEDEVIEYSKSLVRDDNIKYLEYGILNYDNWQGKLSIAILKPYNVESYLENSTLGGN